MTEQLTRADISEMLTLLTEAVTKIGDVATAVSEKRERDRRTRWVIGVLVVAVLGVGGLSYSNRVVMGAIEDCTIAGGQCYEDGRKRTGEAVGHLDEGLSRNLRVVCDTFAPERRPAECPPAR